MQVVGCGDIDGIDLSIPEKLPPILIPAFCPELPSELLGKVVSRSVDRNQPAAVEITESGSDSFSGDIPAADQSPA
jgi:hypothetical protein